MNNIHLINKKKKFGKVNSHGDIVGNRNFQMVDEKMETKALRPTKRVNYKNGEESKTVDRHGKKRVNVPHERPVTGDDTILHPKADPEAAKPKKKRQYPKPEPRKTSSRRRYLKSKDLPKDHWVYDPETSAKYANIKKTGKVMTNSPRHKRNVLTGESSDQQDINGLGILPSVKFTKTLGVQNKMSSARKVSSRPGTGNKSSVSHNILQWDV